MKNTIKLGLLAVLFLSLNACTKEPMEDWCGTEDSCNEEGIEFDIDWSCKKDKTEKH